MYRRYPKMRETHLRFQEALARRRRWQVIHRLILRRPVGVAGDNWSPHGLRGVYRSGYQKRQYEVFSKIWSIFKRKRINMLGKRFHRY